jgi:hypothetical protein
VAGDNDNYSPIVDCHNQQSGRSADVAASRRTPERGRGSPDLRDHEILVQIAKHCDRSGRPLTEGESCFQ